MEQIVIEGWAINRSIKINGQLLESELGFDWGYGGAGPNRLAEQLEKVLLEHYQNNPAIIKVLSRSAAYNFPQGNFKAAINLEALCDLLQQVRPVHVFEILQIWVGENALGDGLWVSKFLDLPNLPWAEFEFKEGTYEYHELQQMAPAKWTNYKCYLMERTKVPTFKPKEYTYMQVEVGENNAYFKFTGGLGKSKFFGNPLKK